MAAIDNLTSLVLCHGICMPAEKLPLNYPTDARMRIFCHCPIIPVHFVFQGKVLGETDVCLARFFPNQERG